MNGFERMHECIAHWTDAGQWELTNDPIVRCKDCLLYDEDRLTCVRDPCRRGDSVPVEPDNFCSWGEPVEDGDGDD